MDNVKRKPISNQSPPSTTKKLRQTTESIHCLEHLSDEIFFEIFDYLDSYEIYHGFHHLNHRFQQLLNSSSLLLKLTHDDSKYNHYKQYLLVNKHKILSMKFQLGFHRNHLFSSMIIDLSFNKLESISIRSKTPDELIPILTNLSSLPHLFSLKIDLSGPSDKLIDIYQLVFALPKLKSFIFLFDGEPLPNSFPLTTNQQSSSIEYLSISYMCSSTEYYWILSHTPQIHYFKLWINIDTNMESLLPITLPNLTSISISMVRFEDLDIFLRKIQGNLIKILHITTAFDGLNYLHAYQLEHLILKFFPQLEEFNFRYIEMMIDEEYPSFLGEINQFSSPFWIQRQSTFDVECLNNDRTEYLIRPYRKRWYEYPSEKFFQYSQSTRLIVKYPVIKNCITRLLNLSQIYHLEYLEETISTNALIEHLKFLPNLETLKIHSLSLEDSNTSSSTCTKIYLENMDKIEELDFLLGLCPQLVYLKIGAMKRTDLQFDLRHIAKQIQDGRCHSLRSLCFCIPTADDEMIENLKKMIQSEKLFCNCRIKRIIDQIYFEWE